MSEPHPNDLPFRSATSEREISPTLTTLISRIVARDPGMAGRFDDPAPMSDEEQNAAILELCKSVDQNAHLRGQSEANPEEIADAWDEGHELCSCRGSLDPCRNPYRAEEPS